MYVVIVRCHVKPEHVEDFKEGIGGNALGALRNEPGCRRFDVVQANDDPTIFWIYELYDDRAAFEQHTTMPHLHDWRAKSKNYFAEPSQLTHATTIILSDDVTN